MQPHPPLYPHSGTIFHGIIMCGKYYIIFHCGLLVVLCDWRRGTISCLATGCSDRHYSPRLISTLQENYIACQLPISVADLDCRVTVLMMS